ncbi:PA3496 family putative envelope integrity protein [Marinobacterium sp. LSUCC0821]|jgi:hypothetical protein|uniref:PA3496 family putative envelope integrity protein n=1 Tax=Marinobacterium sp. LSUCC0821 TaxID=2668067 RepID=UPI0014512158|nr:hypothetical protein [Marinobacterium sp. LSUCC0821]QJD71888.1 hypothetical protein HH196_09360 [Marinobacterium sp. LSUCC0821]
MLVREEEQLDAVKTEIFDILVGYEDERTLEEKRTQSQRLLNARRAIEQRREERELSSYFNEEDWFE